MTALSRFVSSALLALCLAPAAHAGDELYLRWDNCFGDGGVYNKVFACDTNSGHELLVGSFSLGQPLNRVDGLETVVDVLPLQSQTLPAWWQFVETGSCRQNSLHASFYPPLASSACLDVWSGAGVAGGFDYRYSIYGSYTGRLKIVEAVQPASAFPLPAGQETFAFQVSIDHAHTTGSPTCGGCSYPVCIAWVSARVDTGGPAGVVIAGRDTPDHGWNVTWQPGAVITVDPSYGTAECQSVTPTRTSTWGSIKSLYGR